MKQRFHKWHFKELLITGMIIAASKCCWGIKLDDWIGLGNCTRSSVWQGSASVVNVNGHCCHVSGAFIVNINSI